jgi:uncharacterized protein involved in type VI secretion and phage assembly
MADVLEGAKPVDLSPFKAALGKGAKVYCGLAVVVKRDGDSAHWEKHTEDNGDTDILVEVDLMPTGEPLTVRLGAAAAGNGWGLWSVPPVGAEVIVAFPDGEMDGMDPVIIRVLSSGKVPDALDGDTLVLIAPKKIIIASQNDKTYVGSEDGTGTEPMVLGNSLETRLSDLEAKFVAHVHPFTGTIDTVHSTCAGTSTATSSTLPHSGDNIKAQKGEVK